jgi:prepilin-type N-terminal cleavage/methylation domain-containing protein
MSLWRSASRFPRRRGATLLEVIISMAVFGVGVLGVIQAQVLVAQQNGLSRRHSRAAAVLRDFVEAVQRWEYADLRLQPPLGAGCLVLPRPDYPMTDAMLGSSREPLVRFGYTATPATVPNASTEGDTMGALTLAGRPYDGLAQEFLSSGGEAERYQLLWSVRDVDTNTTLPGCEARLVSVAVRYPISAGGSTYRNVTVSFIKHDTARMNAGGIAEIF